MLIIAARVRPQILRARVRGGGGGGGGDTTPGGGLVIRLELRGKNQHGGFHQTKPMIPEFKVLGLG